MLIHFKAKTLFLATMEIQSQVVMLRLLLADVSQAAIALLKIWPDAQLDVKNPLVRLTLKTKSMDSGASIKDI